LAANYSDNMAAVMCCLVAVHGSGQFRIIGQVLHQVPVWAGRVFRQSSASLTVQYCGEDGAFELDLQLLFSDHRHWPALLPWWLSGL